MKLAEHVHDQALRNLGVRNGQVRSLDRFGPLPYVRAKMLRQARNDGLFVVEAEVLAVHGHPLRNALNTEFTPV